MPKAILKFAKGDRGAMNHYAMLDDEDFLENVHDITNGPTFTLPNGQTLMDKREKGNYLPTTCTYPFFLRTVSFYLGAS